MPPDPIEVKRSQGAMVLSPGWTTGSTWPTETVVALNSIAARNTSRVEGNVAVILAGTGTFLSGSTELSLEANAEITGNVRADGIGTVASSHIMGTAAYNLLVGDGTIAGATTTSLTTPLPIPVVATANFTAGTTDRTYTGSTINTLSTGSHGTITLDSGTPTAPTILRLGSGTYYVNAIVIGDYARLECASTSSNACTIAVKGRVSIGNWSYFGPGSSSSTTLVMGKINLFVEGDNGAAGPSGLPAAVGLGERSQLHAFTFVPNGTLSFGASNSGIGKFIAKDVNIGADTELMTGLTTQRVLLNRYVVGPTWPKETLTALNSIHVLSNTTLTGDSLVIQDGSGSFLSTSEAVIESSSVLTGDFKADRIELKSGARITKTASYNTIVNAGMIGAAATPVSIPVDVRVPVFPVTNNGSSSRTISARTNQTLTPGNYRDLTLSAGITTDYTELTLSGGLYQFRKITLGTYSKLICATTCEVRVMRNIAAGNFTEIGPAIGVDPAQLKVFVYGFNNNRASSGPNSTYFAVSIGQNSAASGLFFAPRGTLEGRSGAELSGRFIARDIKLGSSSTSVVAGTTDLPPAIQTQPADVEVVQGQPATFTVQATGTDVTLQWRRNNMAIAGATSGSYTLPTTLPADSGSLFTVVVSNSLGTVTSTAALLTVNICDPDTYVPTVTTCGVGGCARTGMLTCPDGAVVNSCTAGAPAANDASCNGVDDDCNGRVDEGYVPTATNCGPGLCPATGQMRCVAGALQNSCINSTTVPTADTTCDGRDDDCNGQIDEDFVPFATSCGEGACIRSGIATCVGGALQDSCVEGNPGSSDATCNGIDEDCDGEADQGYDSVTTSCGAGVCRANGETDCVDGVVIDSCRAGSTSNTTDTTCDGVDDNCNGQVDEGYVNVPTTCGVGACGRTGTRTCVSGVLQDSCAPGAPAASDTTCNNVDDNCNGTRDEGYVVTSTSCGVGACGRTGSNTCVNGSVINSCTPGTPAASDTTCDNVDDNCNGTKDEGYVVTSTSCGVGACGRTGSNTCVNGSVVNSCTPGTPAASDTTCNNIDDNCNGATDEGYVSTVTSCGVGACGRAGATSCVSGSVQDSCIAGTPAASDTTCDNVDDNCNGTKDEGYVSLATSCGVGACAANGVTSCVSGTVQSSCVIGAPAANDATCDGRDDDCDGVLDENYVSVATSCGVGACGRTGATSCSGGNVLDNCTAGAPLASDATCNGIDENCNGSADEEYVNSATSCGVGACVSSGVRSCVNGSLQDSCVAGTPAASDATCNNVDDNCNGSRDEGYVPIVTHCGSGGCATTGMSSCVSGAVLSSCVPSTTDTDGDGLADCTDLCPLDPLNDEDGDGHCADVDNCDSVFNPDQVDTDGDNAGDACDAPVMIAVTAGGDHSCALFQDRVVRCWGDNTDGQLGNGANVTVANLVTVSGLTDAQELSAGKSHTCVRRTTGGVRCWGSNAKGQLGNGTTVRANQPVTVSGVSDALQIATGDTHSCALLESSVVCWGDNAYGQLGNGTIVSSSTPVTVAGLSDALQISAGFGHSCAVRATGAIVCWGYNQDGELGNGTVVNSLVPVAVTGITDAQQVGAGTLHSCALRSNGAVACWGANLYGQLGNGTLTDARTPVAVSGPSDAVQLGIGMLHSCVLTASSDVRCWGYNSYGSLGNGTWSDASTGTLVSGVGNATQVAAGSLHSCIVRSTGQVSCWGNGEQGQLGQGMLQLARVPAVVVGVADAVGVAAGAYNSCALQGSGTVLCWGPNGSGELGDGTTIDSSTPIEVSGLSDATAIAAGDSHACALRSSGAVVCWGTGGDGQLGDGAAQNANRPVTVSGISNAIGVATGADHSCAVLATGVVRCWGYGIDGALGDGSTTSASTPVTVSGITDAIGVAAGVSHTCALSAGGTVHCWGLGLWGRLANGGSTNSPVPFLVPGLSDAIYIATGDEHTCAVRATSEVQCWGNNTSGQVGPLQPTRVYSPQPVGGLSGGTTVAAGGTHTCAALASGQIRCWGRNVEAQLGNGTVTASPNTTVVSGISTAIAVSTGLVHSCAVNANGTVSCWGDGDGGRLGNAYPWSNVPVRVIWP